MQAIVGLSSPDRHLRFPDEKLNEKNVYEHAVHGFSRLTRIRSLLSSPVCSSRSVKP